jgi:signal transduction histidine kinase/ligand-binding sensor domain-containing protein/DNA-binding response OmpR family regulator
MRARTGIGAFALAAISALLLAPASFALQQQLRFERISVEHGLSHVHVTAIAQDDSGFMWIGTRDGLNRFDGYDFIVYRNDPSEPKSLSDNEIRNIVEDDFGNLWVGTRAGLNRLNRATGEFTHYVHDPNNELSISDNDITALFQDHQSVLWVGTRAGGLNRFNHANESFDRFQNNDPEDPVSSISQGPVVAIYEDMVHKLWVAVRGRGHGALDEFNRKTDSFIHTYGCPSPDHGDCTHSQTEEEYYQPVAYDINGLYQDTSGAFWMASDSGAYQEHKGWITNFANVVGDPKSISHSGVLAPLQDTAGTLWFGTKAGGLNRMGPPKKVNWIDIDDRGWYRMPDDPTWASVFDSFHHDPNDPQSLSSDNLTVTYRDRFGVIWIGTGDAGLNKLNPDGARFGYYKHEPESPNTLSDNQIVAHAEDRGAILWFGTLKGTLNRLDRIDGKITHYSYNESDPNSLPDASINALFVDKEDVLWVGTRAGLSRFDKVSGKATNYNLYPVGPSVLGVLSIAEYPAGTLWLGTSASLTRFDIESKEFKHYWSNPGDENALHGDIFDVVRADKNGKVWVASVNAGLNRFDPETEIFTHYRHDPGNLNSLSDDHVTSIREDYYASEPNAGAVMWFGTRNGLDRFDSDAQEFMHFDMDDGLPSNHVTGIAPDGDKNHWITTESAGLSKFDPVARTFENFDVIDGLQGNRFFNHVVHVTGSGEVVASGPNGINIFSSDQIVTTAESPLLTTVKLYAGTAEMRLGPNDRKLTLANDIEDFGFQFAALNSKNPARTQYAYKLEGHDDDWITTDSNDRVARYRGVVAGDYLFRVRAKLANGDWGEQNTSIQLGIPTSVWQTRWAYATYVLAIMLGVYLVMNMRAMALRRQAGLLESKVAERTLQVEQNERLIQHQADHLEELLQVKEKLFTNISHEFRTPLTLILGPIERMLRKATDSESSAQLSMVKENSQRLLRLVDQLLGLSRLSAEEPVTRSPQPLLPLATSIVESFQPLAEEKRIQLDVVNGEGLWVRCAPDALEKILLNLVSNAIKYTSEGGWVNVRIASAEPDLVRLSVSDSGIGIEPKDHQAVFERFYRANGNGHGNGNGNGVVQGAGLGLALVKELAEAFDGSVELESRPGLGTTISVLLPRHRVRPTDVRDEVQTVESGLIPLEVAVSNQSNNSEVVELADKSNGKPSLLIVEDNADMQRYLRSLFSEEYDLLIAADGEDGVRIAIDQIPDLVICDVMLPNMDGFEVSKILKTNEATSHVPIVMLTGRGDHDSRIHGLREHVDDYLTKPFNDEELSLRIENLLNSRDTMKRRYSKQLFDGSSTSGELGPREQKFLDKLQLALEERFADPEFRVEQLAAALAMSDRQLQRKLKALVDHSPAEYLRSFRLTMAKKKLNEGASVGLAAESVGFSSQAYFASCFKSEFGRTPSDYQHRSN